MVFTYNGGLTLTHMPSITSLVLGAASEDGCAQLGHLDQRGYLRNDGACDLGAVEREALPPAEPTATPTETPTAEPADDPTTTPAPTLTPTPMPTTPVQNRVRWTAHRTRFGVTVVVMPRAVRFEYVFSGALLESKT